MVAPAQPLMHGITRLDTLQSRAGMAACYAIVRNGEVAFVEAGTSPGVPALLAWLESEGLSVEQVRYVMPTHVHLDHAGGAGLLMRACPNARLVVHPRGARHMIDPTALIAGATAVYGPEMVKAEYGEIAPIAADRVDSAEDGSRWALGDTQLQILDAPGHAKHHYCVYDATSQGLFTGDVFGLSYREFDTAKGPFLIPTTTPVQFDPDAWHDTLDRLLATGAERAFLTHFGVVEGLPALAATLRRGIEDYVQLARAAPDGEGRHEALRNSVAALAHRQLRAHGVTLDDARIEHILGLDFDLNAQGLGVWLDKVG
ncbi:MBL fold metallo-hydrolase [Polycyclovorans algicola]|uniref:MBL fold metallo-hydrolase n=1 Tax=Polycyclovorans algicola TaxID=616992 RepID=UPI0004A6F902|nr:MBL fold metallo-hydrolase [Polycyclovorans algicola]